LFRPEKDQSDPSDQTDLFALQHRTANQIDLPPTVFNTDVSARIKITSRNHIDSALSQF
jgi:hypothetical protein